MNKTLCIIPQKHGLGGPASFQSQLVKVLKVRGFSITNDPLDTANSAVLVVGGTRHLQWLRQTKRNGVRVVQRLNGMNWVHRKTRTGIKHFIRAEINNYILSNIRNMADRIVYQSNFTHEWWNRVRGVTNKPEAVIYNGVDLEKFSPFGEGTPPLDTYRILMVEGNLGNGYEQGLDSAIRMVQLLNQRMDRPVELMVAGRVSEQIKESCEDKGVEIVWKGVVDRDSIPALDRSAHVLFSSDVNASCPNSVIEAMACGLPVIGFDTGALPELVHYTAGVIARYGSDVWKLEKPDVFALADAAQKILLNQETFRQGARQQAVDKFNIYSVVDRYIQILFYD